MVAQKCPIGSRYLEFQLAGGLGNQLFQLAYGISLCLKLNAHIKFKEPVKGRSFALAWLGITNGASHGFIVHDQKIALMSFSDCTCSVVTNFREPSFISIPKFNFSENTLLYGYFQSEIFFLDYQELIKDYFLSRLVSQTQYRSIKSNSVVLHARLGDFYRSRKARRFHGYITDDYVLAALNEFSFFSNNLILNIVTDDPEILHEILPTSARYASSIISSDHVLDDLRILAESKSLIISNSTFSWWGAYLSGANVIAPAKWFAGKYADLALDQFLYPHYWNVI
jgi:hypothetical protein